MTNPQDAGVTAEELRRVALPTRRRGYDQDAVDDFLAEAADQLDRSADRRELTAQQVDDHIFPPSGMRSGYDQQPVDELLEAVRRRLLADEVAATARDVAGRDPAEAPAAGPAPTAGTGPGGVDPARPAALPDLPPAEAASPQPPAPEPTTSGPASGPVAERESWWRRLTGRRR